ncbi:hypothetical protein EFD55_25835 [Rhizobium pisi]|uniref:Uncharacterized protein n=2 Tax=Rhizobium TaxID=379 RepID=A0ABY0B1X5_9HYPH|nr:hypothetical protein EFD55_25835 [Rhizobium pisi]RUM08479.1 hypothetical protein EFB14_27375 [Rhizobium fabae]
MSMTYPFGVQADNPHRAFPPFHEPEGRLKESVPLLQHGNRRTRPSAGVLFNVGEIPAGL